MPALLVMVASLQLAPPSVTLDRTRPVGQIVAVSREARDVVVDLQSVAWTQTGDADAFDPTSEILAVPAVFDLPPHESVLVRVGLAAESPAPDAERAFQVRFRDVASPDGADASGAVAARVFVAPAERRGEVRYELERTGERTARLVVHDEGNVHVHVGRLRVVVHGHDVYAGSPDLWVLANNTRAVALSLQGALDADGAELVIDDGGAETTVDVPVR